MNTDLSLEEMLGIAKEVPVWKKHRWTRSLTFYDGRNRKQGSSVIIAKFRQRAKDTSVTTNYYFGGVFYTLGNKLIKSASGDGAKSIYEIATNVYDNQRFFKLLPPKKEPEVEELPWYRRMGR